MTSLREIRRLSSSVPCVADRFDRAHGQHRPDAERHRGGIPHLDAGGVERVRQPLAAPFRPAPRARSSRPRPRRDRPPSSRAAGDRAILERRCRLVPERFSGAITSVANRPASSSTASTSSAPSSPPCASVRPHSCGVLERERDIGNRRAVGHVLRAPPLRSRQRSDNGLPFRQLAGDIGAQSGFIGVARLNRDP